jgi:hypothetical protein
VRSQRRKKNGFQWLRENRIYEFSPQGRLNFKLVQIRFFSRRIRTALKPLLTLKWLGKTVKRRARLQRVKLRDIISSCCF